MPIEPNELKISLEGNIKTLIARMDALKDENSTLQEELEKSKLNIMIAHKEILELKSKYDSLRMAKSLAKSDDDVEFSQQRLSKLVREINKCIALLNQQ